MNSEQTGYASPLAVQQAISSAAKTAAKHTGVEAHTLVRQEYFRRLLTRVFVGEHGDRWVLKGGNAMLARTPDARATRDVDLLFTDAELGEAEAELIAAAGRDIGDFFRFVHTSSKDQLGGENQRYTAGRRVVFDVYLGVKRMNPVSIDLVVGTLPIGPLTVQEPANALELPRLASVPYRIYPVPDHIADKVCAILETHPEGAASSREKDLVDLVVLAVTEDQCLEAGLLKRTIRQEASRRGLVLPPRLAVPKEWGTGYRKLVAQTAAAVTYPDIPDAIQLMRIFLDPILTGQARGTWSALEKKWDHCDVNVDGVSDVHFS